MLPYVVRWLGLHREGKAERKREIQSELAARQAALKAVRERLEKIIKEHDLPGEAVEHLRTRNQSRVQILPTNLTEGLDHMRDTAKIKAELIEAERDFIYQLLRDGKITDEARRRIEYELDLEEASVANRGQDGGGWM
jgi:CPA1 family monovalent cation:H+ antiporter